MSDLSEKQKNHLFEAHKQIREAQKECENIDHPFYRACDELLYQISDITDEE